MKLETLNGGENSTKNPNSYTTEDTITLKDATKDYYTFDGWYKEPEFINRVKTLNGQYGDLTLYAKFIPFTYSSTFDASGGQIDNEINIRIVYGNDFDDEFITINANSSLNIHNLDFPYKTGYTFAGFFFDKEFTQPVLSSNQLNTDQTIYAKWDTQYSEIHTNNWLLNVNDPYAETSERPEGRKSTSTTMTYMVPLYSTGTFTLELDSWYGFRTGIGTNYTIINLTTGTTLFSGRLSNSCEKVFNCNPGDIIQCSCSSVTTDSTSNYKVNYALLKVVDIERSDCCTSYTGTDYKCNQQYGELVSIPTVSKQGYDFTGWYDEQNNPISNTWNYTSDQNFHAEWSIHNYSVSYNLNGGLNNPSNPTSFVYTDYIELLSPEREGYTFAGWYSDASFKNKVTYIDGSTFNDIELFAKWIPNSYTVTLDYNGGQNCPTIKFYSQGNVIKTVDLYKDSTFDYFIPEAPNESLKFGGWYTDSNCTKLFSFDGVVNTDINLYAKWINVSNSEYSQLGNDVDVQINGNNYGYIAICSPINQTITITSSSGLDLYGVIYDSNWNIIASCDDISDENFDFSITITLEAGKMYYIGYKANQVSISGDCVISISGINQPDTFITGDYTEIIGSINVTYDTSFELPVPKKKGCEFIGWFDENGNPIDLTSWNYSENITIYAHWRAI